MVFSAPAFLFLFLPWVLLCSLAGDVRTKNLLLIGWSLLFYYYGGGPLLILLLASCLVNWGMGLALEKRPSRPLLTLGVLFNVGVLVYYKYANFIVAQLGGLKGFHQFAHDWQAVTLPIGISFFTFQGMSYMLDVWRREMKAFRNPLDVILCVSFFPHLIAGPIVRLSHLADQLHHRHRTWEDFVIGAARFTWGLGKKVLIADVCSKMANAGFDTDPHELRRSAAWLALLGYTLQIYFDFSGYSDMAVGLARMFGFRFPENFLHPYTAVSVTDFWRRWHMSLSTWFRDYLYFPLGGNRVSPIKVYRNLLIVFLVTGFWHGANWTFVIWGLFHGGFLMLERWSGLARLENPWLTPFRRLATLLVVMVSWAIFRSADAAACRDFLGALLHSWTKAPFPVSMIKLMDVQTWLAFGIGCLAFIAPRQTTGGLFLGSDSPWAQRARAVILLGLLPVVISQVLASDYSPFLYFQF